MRVATLNLWGRSGAWTDRRSLLVDGFRDLRPELVAFQESIKTDDYDQVTDLLGDDFHVVHQQARAADGMGVSIASRWPLGQVREVDLHVTSRTADFPCATLVAEILAPNPVGPLLFVNHFPSWQPAFEHERELQAVLAARSIEELADRRRRHVVLAGDLDADPDAASVRFWSGRQALSGTSVCYRDPPGVTMGRADHRDIVLVAGTDPYAYKGTVDVMRPHVRPDGQGGCLR
jgi:endonuclease/exonuclease/phosphatase family metal-dependent hydrolase